VPGHEGIAAGGGPFIRSVSVRMKAPGPEEAPVQEEALDRMVVVPGPPGGYDRRSGCLDGRRGFLADERCLPMGI
jgi:hypothetical protein